MQTTKISTETTNQAPFTLTFVLCCITEYNTVPLLLHCDISAAGGTLFQ